MIRGILLFIALFSTSALSQTFSVGIDSRIVDSMAQSQHGDELCWAASAQMVLNYYGINVEQLDVVRRVHHDTDNRPASDAEVTASLNGWRNSDGTRVTHAQMRRGLPNVQILIDELQNRRPVVLTFSTGPNSGHVVVATGAVFERTAAGSVVRLLIIRDPWPSPQHRATAGKVQYSGYELASFAQTIENYWTISLTTDLRSRGGDIDLDDSPAPRIPRSSSRSRASCEDGHEACIERIETVEDCVAKSFDGCMTSCQNDYGNSYAACRSNFCNASNGSNRDWEITCRRIVRMRTSICDSRQQACERASE